MSHALCPFRGIASRSPGPAFFRGRRSTFFLSQKPIRITLLFRSWPELLENCGKHTDSHPHLLLLRNRWDGSIVLDMQRPACYRTPHIEGFYSIKVLRNWHGVLLIRSKSYLRNLPTKFSVSLQSERLDQR